MTDEPLPWEDLLGTLPAAEAEGERAQREAAFLDEVLRLSLTSRVGVLANAPVDALSRLANITVRRLAGEVSPDHLLHAGQIEAPERYAAILDASGRLACGAALGCGRQWLASLTRALAPGGRVLIDLSNREMELHNTSTSQMRAAADGTVYLERREVDLATSVSTVSWTVVSTRGERRELESRSVRLLTLTETIALIEGARLLFDGVYGGYTGAAYDVESSRMLVVARSLL